MTNTISLSRKKSGNYTVSTSTSDAWELIGTFTKPCELLAAVKELPAFSTVIKSEYSQSQLKTMAKFYDEKDALRAFGLSIKKDNLVNFNNL